MKSVHIVIPDLFLPQQLAAFACADLRLPALEKMLSRAHASPIDLDTLESWLCERFGVDDMAIAPISLQADGIPPGDAYWLCASPVGISLQRDEMVLRSDITLSAAEALQLCESLNAHFAADGLRFVAPHPQRWYLQLGQTPKIRTHPLSQVVGANMHAYLPTGADALRWHSVLNEIQMLFYEHSVNRSREARGEPVIGSVWLWGGGKAPDNLPRPFVGVAGDSELAKAFARVADIPLLAQGNAMLGELFGNGGEILLASEGLRSALQYADIGSWRAAVQAFEKCYAVPLLAALSSGRIDQITLDILSEGGSRRFGLNRAESWKFWRFPKPLASYALVQGFD